MSVLLTGESRYSIHCNVHGQGKTSQMYLARRLQTLARRKKEREGEVSKQSLLKFRPIASKKKCFLRYIQALQKRRREEGGAFWTEEGESFLTAGVGGSFLGFSALARTTQHVCSHMLYMTTHFLIIFFSSCSIMQTTKKKIRRQVVLWPPNFDGLYCTTALYDMSVSKLRKR